MRQWHFNGPDQDWFTAKEVAAYLEIGMPRLKELIDAGLFPRGIRSGASGRMRWSGADIAAFLYLRSRCAEVAEKTERRAPEKKS